MALGTVQRGTPLITSVDVGTTETSHTFRAHIRGYQIHCNEFEDIRWAWGSADTANGGDYQLLRAGAYVWEDDVYSGGEEWVIYLKAPDVVLGTVEVSIQEWL